MNKLSPVPKYPEGTRVRFVIEKDPMFYIGTVVSSIVQEVVKSRAFRIVYRIKQDDGKETLVTQGYIDGIAKEGEVPQPIKSKT